MRAAHAVRVRKRTDLIDRHARTFDAGRAAHHLPVGDDERLGPLEAAFRLTCPRGMVGDGHMRIMPDAAPVGYSRPQNFGRWPVRGLGRWRWS